MAMHVPRAPGFSQMLKDGAKHYSGVEEAVLKNIDACKELSKTTRSAYGPSGQNKMVINHLEKLFVTNDAATILRELEVQHPAAKMLVMASHQQEEECGDGTNFVIIFAGELLAQAEDLIKMGLSVTEIQEGYELACNKALEFLPNIECGNVDDLKNNENVAKALKTSIMSKQFGNEDFLSELIANACVSIIPQHQKSFNVDNIRVNKILGQGIYGSTLIQGMVFRRQVEGDVTKAENCKVAVYSCPLDLMQTETKGVVNIQSAQELLDFSKGEETQVEAHVKAIAETGCSVIVAGGKVGELYLHYCNKYKLMVIRLLSKFDLRRLCKAIKATPLPRITPPTAEEAGHVDQVRVDEIGDNNVIVFNQEKEESAICTIVIRGSSENIMDDIERAIDDGVNTYKALTKDRRLVPGAGATEMELAKHVREYGETCPGLEQYAIQRFAQAFHTLPKALAENTGVKSNEVISKLMAAHNDKQQHMGYDIEAESAAITDVVKKGIVDLFLTKYWGIKFATQAACTVLRVDQIIMAKQAGGPKPKENKDWDED